VKSFFSRRHLGLGIVLAVAALTCYDLTRPPIAQWSAAVAVSGIHLYQDTLAPALGALGVGCRFEPSCSRYAVASIRQLGMLKGGWRALRRIARCGPWTPQGTVDPP
jgi:putative membrane protein insertion efficiency factor